MIVSLLQHSFERVASISTDYHLSFHPALFIAVGLGSVLCLWRLWRFTIRPYLRPDEPKELPYWIPCTYGRFVGDDPANSMD